MFVHWRFGVLGVLGAICVCGTGCNANWRIVRAPDMETVLSASAQTARQWGFQVTSAPAPAELEAAPDSASELLARSTLGNDVLDIYTTQTRPGRYRVAVRIRGAASGTENYFLDDIKYNLRNPSLPPWDPSGHTARASLPEAPSRQQ